MSRSAASASRDPLLAGALVVAFSVAGGRWGAYLGAPPIFVTDVLFLAALLHAALGRLVARTSLEHHAAPRDFRFGMVLLSLFLFWVAFRWMVTPRLDLVALRDLAPFAYGALGLLASNAIRRASSATRERTMRLIFPALVVHMLWNFLATVVDPTLPLRLPPLPGSTVTLFSVRPDIDTAMVGVLGALLVVRIFKSGRPSFWLLALLAMSLATIFSPGLRPSRAGVAGAAIALAVAIVIAMKGADRHRRSVGVVALILAAFAIVAVLPNTTVYERTLGTFGNRTNMVSADAAGTTSARTQTWTYLTDWIQEDPRRQAIGVGFGPHFLAESRAAYLLIHRAGVADDDPRSPHNFWITAYARLGLMGLLLFTVLCAAIASRGFRLRRQAYDDELLLFATLVPAALLIPFTFGVILESPFGAVPFYWSVGILLGWSTASKDALDPAGHPCGRTPVKLPFVAGLSSRP